MAGASGLVLRRAFTQKLVVLAAFGTILLATTILSTLILYATSVTDEGIERTLTTAPIDDVGTRLTARLDSIEGFTDLDRQIRAATEAAYAGVQTEVVAAVRSESFSLPGQEDELDPQLTVFAFYERIEDHARLTAGAWPGRSSTADEPVDVAIPAAAAQTLAIAVEDTLTVHSRLANEPVEAVVTGLFEPLDKDSPYWQVDELARDGVQQLAFTTYGPLVVPQDTFRARFTTDTPAAWQVIPDMSTVSRQQVRAFTDAAATYTRELDGNQAPADIAVDTNLSTLATNLDRASLVARSTMLIPVLQLVVLAGYALFLTARLLADHRRAELALLRARGADGGQLAALTLREGMLLAAPAAAAAPLLAAPLLTLVNASPTVRAAGLTIDDSLRLASWLAAAIAAAVCAFALAVPSIRGANKTYVESQQARGRGERRSVVQRAGADIAVLAIALLGYWQLRHYGGPLTASADGGVGGLDIDPLIVTGPAIGLFAGGVLALRLVPIMSGAAERITSRGSGFAPALGAWQVARRPLRYAGPALLLVLAVAVGVLSLGTSATWRKSQVDQANHQAGADLRIIADVASPEMPALGHGGRYRALPGVAAISPAVRVTGVVGDRPTQLVALDADVAADLLVLRPDLLPSGGIAPLTSQLAATRLPTSGAAVPGEPVRLAIDTRLGLAIGESRDPFLARAAITMHLRDGAGAGHSFALGDIEADGQSHTFILDLAERAGGAGEIAYPLSLESFTFSYTGATGDITPRVMAIERVRGSESASGDFDAEVTLPEGSRWDAYVSANLPPTELALPKVNTDDALLRTTLPTSTNDQVFGAFGVGFRAYLLLTETVDTLFPPIGERERPVIDAVVTADLLATTQSQVGDTIVLTGAGSPQPIRIVGTLGSLPTVEPGNSGVLVDFRSWSTAQFTTSGTIPLVREWWIRGAGGDAQPASAELAANPQLADEAIDRHLLAQDLLDDPLGGGLQGALYLGFLAAFAFAAIGFAVNAAVSARERLTEFALMRAMGVSSRQVFGLLGVEQAILVGLGVVGGALLGVLVTRLVVPHIVLTAQATQVTPPVVVSIPWLQVAALVAGVVAVLAVIVAVLASSLRRGGLGAVLRIGEDR